jgi:hypothetical protein
VEKKDYKEELRKQKGNQEGKNELVLKDTKELGRKNRKRGTVKVKLK